MGRSPSRRRMSGAATCTKLRERIPFGPMLFICLYSEQERVFSSLLSHEIEYHLFAIANSWCLYNDAEPIVDPYVSGLEVVVIVVVTYDHP